MQVKAHTLILEANKSTNDMEMDKVESNNQSRLQSPLCSSSHEYVVDCFRIFSFRVHTLMCGGKKKKQDEAICSIDSLHDFLLGQRQTKTAEKSR